MARTRQDIRQRPAWPELASAAAGRPLPATCLLKAGGQIHEQGLQLAGANLPVGFALITVDFHETGGHRKEV